MSNIIAVIWDFDKTLVDGYMQNPIFEKYKVNSDDFWAEVNSMPDDIFKEQEVKVNPETIYLNKFIRESKEGGLFEGLNNDELKELGKELRFYPGVLSFLEKLYKIDSEYANWKEYGITVENYIVSTGFSQMIKGSKIVDFVKKFWGCEVIEKDGILSEIGYTIDNTTKTRALFEINKGVGIVKDIDVNTKMPEEVRRVQFKNMIYIADGPSDVPAFSLMKKNGGATFAVYPRGDYKALKQVENLRKGGRVDMFAEANYEENTTANMWIINKVEEFANRIIEESKSKLLDSVDKSPKHLT